MHAPTDDKSGDMKDIFYTELDRARILSDPEVPHENLLRFQ